MPKIRLTIFDETLRDGEQQVGIFFDPQIKLDLANLIAATGVQKIALMPAIHPTEADLLSKLVQEISPHNFAASTMMAKQYIDQAVRCGVKQIILFHAVSDRLLWLRDPKIKNNPTKQFLTPQPENHLAQVSDIVEIPKLRQEMQAKVIANCEYAISQGLQVSFAAEDASRADLNFLADCINNFAPYLDNFLLCDTVGILNPATTKTWISKLVDLTKNILPLMVHFHNDRGLALENTIQAVLAGAKGISGTFGGIGERAGNVALDQVLNGLKLRCGWQVEGINYQAFEAVLNYQKKHNILANQPYSPETLRCETGIHVDSLLTDRGSYYLFPNGEPEIWFGKFSGASNFQYLFEKQLKQTLAPEKYQEFRDLIKLQAIAQKRSFSAEETIQILQSRH